jgi:hypothetical protein
MHDTDAKKRCPRCGSDDVLPIVYGLPSRQMFEDARDGRIILGGEASASAVFIGQSPAYGCDVCDYRWGLFTHVR